jgi:DNA-binding LacI/PurR family transcriptional regulator
MTRTVESIVDKSIYQGAPVVDRASKELSVRAGRRPTIHDVARSAAVSPATVSNVLTGRRHVDPDLAERVRRSVDELGYRRDVAASTLRSAQRTVVGAVVPELGNPFFAEMVDRLKREARLAGRHLLVATSGSDPAEELRQIEALIAWRPAGIIVVPCHGTFPARALLEREGIPFVVLDRPIDDGARVDTVAVDNLAAARDGAARLLAEGHRRILLVISAVSIGNVRERVAGVDEAVSAVPGAQAELLEAGLEVEGIAEAVAKRLVRAPRPTAIFTVNNVLTLGTLKAMAALGITIPDDVSLLGFDDYDWMEVFRPPLSAIRQPVAEMAHAAWDRLAVLTGASPMGEAPPTCHVRLPCSLAWRESVAPPRTSASVKHPKDLVLPP